MKLKKYKLTITKYPTLYQIQALKDFGDVKTGDLGGFVESEKNLSQEGTCWIYDNARAYGDAQVSDDAKVSNNAEVFRNAKVFGNAKVYGCAEVSSNAKVFGNAKVYGIAEVYGNAKVFGNAKVYGNTKIYGNSTVIGDAEVFENAQVFGNAEVYGTALVYGNTLVCDRDTLGDNDVVYDNKYIIVDIDGTIAEKHPDRDYREYDKVHLDSPIYQTIYVINLMIKDGFKPIFITGRKDDCKLETTEWLKKHIVGIDNYENILYMRKSKPKDHREDFIVKKELLNKFLNDFNATKENIFAVFDDRPSVIDMWLNEGLFVFNMNNGRGDF